MSKTPRNAPCPCGSGKKYKHCCLQIDLEAERESHQTKPEPIVEDLPAKKPPKFLIALVGGVSALSIILGLILSLQILVQAGLILLILGLVATLLYYTIWNPPSLRNRPGDGGNIDFGNRQ